MARSSLMSSLFGGRWVVTVHRSPLVHAASRHWLYRFSVSVLADSPLAAARLALSASTALWHEHWLFLSGCQPVCPRGILSGSSLILTGVHDPRILEHFRGFQIIVYVKPSRLSWICFRASASLIFATVLSRSSLTFRSLIDRA